jgi:cytochrome c biogenesis protein
MNPSKSPPRYLISNLLRDVFELIGSMRFAVSLLMFICIASVIGTVLAQNRPSNTYIDQFGPFWYEVFDKFSIWHVYNSWWFLTIMGFLVISTSVCLIRNTPKMMKDARSFREYVRANSLRAFPHRVEIHDALTVAEATESVKKLLSQQGYAIRDRHDGDSVMVAAKKGSSNRLGYIFAHAAMVIICVGGLLDSELAVRLQVLLGGKQPIVENMLISEVPASGRLSVDNPSFRASVLIPEDGQASSAIVMVGDGALVQPLPFTIKLNKFLVDYYSTGMPSRFASEVQVTDPESGHTFDATIEVNEPLHYKGVTVYQSSFDDGGSSVSLQGFPLAGSVATPFALESTVGKSADINAGAGLDPADQRQVEITALRPINVEDFSGGLPSGTPKTIGEHVASVTGSAAGKNNDHLRNVGPSVEYRLIDQAGQAHEFVSYMLPVELEGAVVFLAGVRNSPSENYRYLRIPADADSSVMEFMHLRAALADPAARREAARRFAQRNSAVLVEQQSLQLAAERALDTFSSGGLQAIAGFLQTNTAPAELERAADVVIRLMGISMAELRAVARERAGMPALASEGSQLEQDAQWSRLAIAALSDLHGYPAPILLSLTDFKHVQASVFQVSRTPGKTAVYIGCLLLVLGVFSMFYIRDRRVWVWIKPAANGAGSDVLAAMTSQKRTLDFNHDFERFKQALMCRNRP